MEAIIIPKDQFQALLARIEQMHQVIEKLSPQQNFIDNAEFARIMGISKRTAQTWRDEKRISFSQVGAKIYYRREDVEQLLMQNLIPAIPKNKNH